MNRLRGETYTTVLIGPPQYRTRDDDVVKLFMANRGKKIVCGGTSANIVARVLHRKVSTQIEAGNMHVPPIGHIQGIDLVTEGMLTIHSAVEILKHVAQTGNRSLLEEKDSSARLAKMLYSEQQEIYLMIGRAVNQSHLPLEKLGLNKEVLLNDLEKVLIRCGKTVIKAYF